jgi:adhesin HecA-like repeat protein
VRHQYQTQSYQNEGKDTIAQANLAITANTVNNQGGQLAAGGNLNIAVDTLNNTQNGLIYYQSLGLSHDLCHDLCH